MNRLLLTVMALTAMLFVNACSRNEKTALEEFKKDVASIKAFAAEKKSAIKGNDEAAGKAAMKEMMAKIKGIKTDGLPADLKDPWTAQVGNMETFVEAMTAGEPTDAAKKAEMEKKMAALFPKMEADTKKLDEAGKKYGIEGLDKLGD
jgi:hypothetical protein